MDISQINPLRPQISGDIILPQDSEYESVRSSFMAQGQPALVVRPKTAQDIAVAISFAREHSLILSIRSGGHDNAGHSTNNGGLVIDLHHLQKVKILDIAKGIVQIEGGAKWGDIAKTLHAHGLALSSGDTTSVGVSGLTLAGGIGWMVRKYGLTLDSLQEVEIVTADGQILRANKDTHADLFWAVRGGGGNFGVVTTFIFVAHPIGDVYAGSLVYAAQNTASFLKGWRDAMRAAPENLTSTLLLLPPMRGNPASFTLLFCWASDDQAAAQKALAPFRSLAPVIGEKTDKKAYYQVLEDAHPNPAMHVVVNNILIDTLDDSSIARIAATFDAHPLILQIRSISGALNTVASDATAFAHRHGEVLIVSPTFVPPGATTTEINAALEPWQTIASLSHNGYINFFSKAGELEIKAAYPADTYQRLAKIKARYDPNNIFNQNYNIVPAL